MKNFLLGLLIIPSTVGFLLIIHTTVLIKPDGVGGEITNRIVRMELAWLAMNKPHLFSDVIPNIFLDIEDSSHFPPNAIVSPALLNSPAFDLSHFIENNPEIAQDLSNEKARIEYYWLTHLEDCLDSSPYFDPVYYLNYYSDLKKVYGDNCSDAVKHWVRYGLSEGRKGVE